jgi:phosphomannomutase/phosphoglucomutase
LFIYLEISALGDIFGDELQGQVTIHQTFRNTEPSAIFIHGSGGFNLVLERPLDNPNWHVSYKPNVELMDQPTGHALFYLAPGLLFLLIATIGVLIGARKSISLVEADSALLQRQMDDVSNGTGDTRARYGLHAFLELDASLTKLRQKQTVPVAVTPPDINLDALTCEQDTTSGSNVEMRDIEAKEIPVVEHEGSIVEEVTDSEYFDTDKKESTEDGLATIFRAYDIRGIINQTLTTEVIKKIGQAIGSEAKELGEQTLIVGADGRISSPAVMDTLINGILTTGTNVHSIGAVPTPLVYFATNTLDTQSGIAITGSHNPADYNGFKIVLRGRTLVSEDIQKLYQRVLNEDFRSGEGQLTESDIRDDYIDAIADDVIVAQPLRVVIDCGNGIAGDIAPDLLSALGCEVLPLYCEVDGSFPNHHPDPTIPANLEDLIITIRSNEADLGIALDGDGDRIVAITGDGEIVWPDQLLMLFAKDVVSRNPGSDVVYDVKCTRHLHSVISSFGGRPIICRSGHSYLKEKIQETDAVLGGELSGHVCFNERWYGFDDGLYAAARLLEIVGAQPKSLKDLMSEFPVSVSTPEIQMFVSETEKFDIIRNFNQLADFEGGTLNNIDGTRVDFSDGWGLIRASNTNPCLTLRFEADDAKSLERIKNDFRQKLKMVDESLEF